MANVFISYSRKNIQTARVLADSFKDNGLEVWIDWEGIPPTVDWWKEIQKGIEDADIFLFLLSPDSVVSKVCRREIEHALQNGKRLIPVVVHETKAEDVPAELSTLNWIFLQPDHDFQAGIEKILIAIRTDYDWVQTHRQLQQKALEWERNKRERSYLLGGKELQEAEYQLTRNASKEPYTTELQRVYVAESRQRADQQRRRTVVVTSITSVVMAILAVVSLIQSRLASERAIVSRAGELAAQSIAQANQSFPVSLLLGIEAVNTRETIQTRGTLLNNAYERRELRSFLAPVGGAQTLAFSPDGSILVTGNAGNITVWDVETGKPIIGPVNEQGVHIAFSPDGKLLAVAGYDGIVVLDAKSARHVQVFKSPQTVEVQSVKFSADGSTVISADSDYMIRVWDVTTGQLVRTLDISQQVGWSSISSVIRSVAFNPTTELLAIGTDNGVKLFDMEKANTLGENLSDIAGSSASSVIFSADGRTIAAATGSSVALWDVETRQQIGESLRADVKDLRASSNHLGSISLSKDGKLLAAGYEDGTIALWDSPGAQSGGPPIRQLDGKYTGQFSLVTNLQFSADGKWMASGYKNGAVIIWDLTALLDETSESVGPAGRTVKFDGSYVNSLAYSSDGKKLASGLGNGTVMIWNLDSKDLVGKSIGKLTSWVLSLAFSPDPDSDLLAAGGCGKYSADACEGEIILWNTKPGKIRNPPLLGHADTVRSIAFSPDGKTLASGSDDQTIMFWDMKTHKPLGKPLTGHTNEVFSVSFSPDGKTLASGDVDGNIILWNVGTRQQIGTPLDGDADAVDVLAFSPDGKLLAAGYANGSIILWNTQTGQVDGQSLVRHTDLIYALAFSPDGSLLASASGDQSVILWDLSKRLPLGQPLRGHNDAVTALAFSPNGQMIASGSAVNHLSTILLWTVDQKSLIDITCQRAGRNFTYQEWQQFFPEQAYRKTCEQFPKDRSYYDVIAQESLKSPARPGQVKKALDRLTREMGQDSALKDPDSHATEMITQLLNYRIFQEVAAGNVKDTIELLAQSEANNLAPDTFLEDASFFNGICWDGSLTGYATDVIKYCDRAVKMSPENGDFRDSRGLARALTGNNSGAIEDFQFFVNYTDNDVARQQRQNWIRDLGAGRNPFSADLLQQLQQ